MTAAGSTAGRFVQLGPFVIDLTNGEVKKNGQLIHITEQPTRVLLALLERPGETISREELRAKLWSNDTNVEFDHGIHAAINKLRQALGDSPEQPKFIETVPRRGYRLIASVTAVMAPVAAEHTPSAEGPAPALPWRSKNALFAGGALSLTLVVVIAALLHFKSKPGFQTSSVPHSVLTSSIPRRIAVVGFRNLSDREESDWLSTAFSEMLATELGTGADLQPVPGADVAQMKRELAIGDADSFTQETLHKIQQNLGTELVLVGSFMPIGRGNPSDRVRFDIHLVNTNTGQTVASLSETGTIADLFDLISDAGLRLRLQLGITPLSSSEQAEIRQSMPTSGVAQGLYFSGLEKIRNFNYKGAREVLTKAVASDPKNSLAHEALSIAFSASGYESLAAKEAQLAFELANGLTYEQGLQVEGRYCETNHGWARAVETYKRLCDLSPQNLDFSLRLAHVQGLNGKPSDALATLHHLRVLSHSAKDSARINLAEASAQQQLGDSIQELAAAQAAATQGEQARAPMVIAQALRMEGVALGYLGDSTQALSKEYEAESIFKNLNDPGGLADALIEEGDILSDRGDMSAAAAAWQRALALAHSLGSKQKEAVISNNLGNLLLMQGDPARARLMYQRSYDILVEVGDKMGQANSLLIIGDALQDEGRLSEATTYYERSSRLAIEIASKAIRAAALQGLAGALLDKGDLVQAKESAEESITVAQASGDKATETAALIYLGQVVAAQGAPTDGQSIEQKALNDADALAAKSLQAWAHVALGHILLMEGKTVAARANSEQALTLEQSIGAGTEERETRYILAELAIEEHRLSDAREMLQRLQDNLKHRQNTDAELECLILQTKLELLDRQDAVALKTALRARAVSTHSERLELQLSATEVLALAAGASRQWAQADRVINSALGRASQSGCVACEFKVQYSQCDLSAKRDASRGTLCFAELNTRAAARGFGLIARNSAAATAILAKGSSHLP
jgi:DNA-binding winged helix-turn-helix (wHTH) protein/tetratricopeptide (TPR) repeat protein